MKKQQNPIMSDNNLYMSQPVQNKRGKGCSGTMIVLIIVFIVLIVVIVNLSKTSSNNNSSDSTPPSNVSQNESVSEKNDVSLTDQEENSSTFEPQSILSITSAVTSKPNSAGGVDLYITWQNKSNKTIKYIYFYAQPYNAVNDPVSCTIRHQSIMKCSSTGPYESGDGSAATGMHWDNAWYNNTIKTVKIVQIEIEYMDGTSITLNEEEIGQIYPANAQVGS